MTRQYLTAKFREGDRRTYTYHNDGEPLAPGDRAKVPGKADHEGWSTVIVVEVGVAQPTFPTKGVLGKAPPPPPEEGHLL